jgi:hypothetical protein
MKTKAIALCIAAVGASGSAFAAVSLDITKGPVTGGVNTGPIIDPHATRGQWFEDRLTQAESYRPYEFYDNIPGSGGGSAGSNAITGVVITSSLVYSGNNITSFSILATITNDLGTQTGPWADGGNSLGESLSTTNHVVGNMWNTMLVTEFALGSISLQPSSWSAPYTSKVPFIIAGNHDELAWYGFNNNQGDYYVPAWDFGNIALGATVAKELQFTVEGAGLEPTDPRHIAIEASSLGQLDLFSNRSNSLKISDWMDTLALDQGAAFDDAHMAFGSNVSVFSEIPEPGTTVPLGLLLGMAALRRSRRCATA